MLSCDFLLKGSFGPNLLVVSTQFLSPCPVIYVVMGLLGLISSHLGSLHIISPRYGLVYAIGFYAVGCSGYYAEMLALGLVAISWLCFISALFGLIGKTTRVMGVLIVITGQQEAFASYIHFLSYLAICHLVLQSYW
jgi:hypothetical protein